MAEATWVSLLLDGAADTSPGSHADIPFLALAFPAAVATAVGAISCRVPWRRRWKVPLLVVIVILGAMATAGTVSALTAHSGSWWHVATQPWSATGHTAAVTAGLAWFVAGLSWGRGMWASLRSLSFRQAAWSSGLGLLAFFGIFAGQASHRASAFRHATGGAGWLLFLWFPLVTAAVALIRQRDLEKEVLSQSRSRPPLVWLMVLAGPMLIVALVALLLDVAIGPGAPVFGRAVARAASTLWDAITTAATWLGHLLSSGRAHSRPARPQTRIGAPRLPTASGQGSHRALSAPGLALEAVAALIVLVLIVYFVRTIHWSRFKWRGPDVDVQEETDSLFSWRHLAAQIREALASRRRRWHRRRPVVPIRVAATTGIELADKTETVRQAYRRVLGAARSSGHGRGTSETTNELRTRLGRFLGSDAHRSLDEITGVYDAVRYGETEPGGHGTADAVRQADTVSLALEQAVYDPAGSE